MANVVRLVGLVMTCAGAVVLAAGGLRVVVSGRIDERRQIGQLAADWGLPLLAVGLLLLFGGTWLANWAVR